MAISCGDINLFLQVIDIETIANRLVQFFLIKKAILLESNIQKIDKKRLNMFFTIENNGVAVITG